MNDLARMVSDMRFILKESQTEFGKRFGVSPTAVSLWESKKREVPNRVTEWILQGEWPELVICKACKGQGLVTTNGEGSTDE